MKEKTLIERVKDIRKEIWVQYHRSQEWKEQRFIADHLDEVINQLKKDNYS